jgi:hypothetical protein
MVIKYNIHIIVWLVLDWRFRFRSIAKQEMVTENSDVKFNLV